ADSASPAATSYRGREDAKAHSLQRLLHRRIDTFREAFPAESLCLPADRHRVEGDVIELCNRVGECFGRRRIDQNAGLAIDDALACAAAAEGHHRAPARLRL